MERPSKLLDSPKFMVVHEQWMREISTLIFYILPVAARGALMSSTALHNSLLIIVCDDWWCLANSTRAAEKVVNDESQLPEKVITSVKTTE